MEAPDTNVYCLPLHCMSHAKDFMPVSAGTSAEIQRQYRTVSAICIDRSSYMTKMASITFTVKEGVKVSAPIPFDSVLVSFMSDHSRVETW